MRAFVAIAEWDRHEISGPALRETTELVRDELRRPDDAHLGRRGGALPGHDLPIAGCFVNSSNAVSISVATRPALSVMAIGSMTTPAV